MQKTKSQHSHPDIERKALKARLRKVAGQVQGIERMLEQDRECSDILTQVVSVRKALKSFSEKLMQAHMIHCIEEAETPAEGKKKLKDMLNVLERYVE